MEDSIDIARAMCLSPRRAQNAAVVSIQRKEWIALAIRGMRWVMEGEGGGKDGEEEKRAEETKGGEEEESAAVLTLDVDLSTSASSPSRSSRSSTPDGASGNTTDKPESTTNSIVLHNLEGPFSINTDHDLAELPGLPPVIFSNKYFTVGPSKLGGYGAISTRFIPSGTKILIEKAIFVSPSSQKSVADNRQQLPPPVAAIFDSLARPPSLDLAKPHTRADVWSQIFNINRYS
jgi:hypothetical protein